jgi:hypothetical protein
MDYLNFRYARALYYKIIIYNTIIYRFSIISNAMPANRRFAGIIHCHVPKKTRDGIDKWAKDHDLIPAEAIRDLLQEGIKAKGIEC